MQATIENMIATAKLGPVPSWTGAGTPWRRKEKVINGHMVQVNVLGWEQTITVNVDRSTEPLTITEAIARLAN